MGPAATLPEVLEIVAGRERSGRIIRSDGSALEMAALAGQAFARARQLGSEVGEPGTPVVLAVGEPVSLLREFLAVVLRGGLPVVTAGRRPQEAGDAAERRLREVAVAAGASAILAGEVLDPAAAGEPGPALRPRPADVAYLQMSSGSTGRPRPLAITHRALFDQLAALRSWYRLDRGDVVGSWLPLWHDFGLVGGALLALWLESDLVLGTPEEFLGSPAGWMDLIGANRVTFTPMIPAGLHLAARVAGRVRTPLALRAVPIGADVIHPAVVSRFEAAFALPAGVALPGYGLADATLVVTCTRPGERWRAVDCLRAGVAMAGARVLRPTLVSLGRPLDNAEVWIERDGERVGQGAVGQVICRSGSRCAGPWPSAAVAPVSPATPLPTGDLGFLLDGELFFVGRLSEAIRVLGEDFLPADVEQVIVDAGLARPGHVAAVGVSRLDHTRLLVVIEAEPPDPEAHRKACLQVARAAGLPLSDVLLVPPGWLPKTTSGKLQRRLVASRLDEGDAFRPRAAGVT